MPLAAAILDGGLLGSGEGGCTLFCGGIAVGFMLGATRTRWSSRAWVREWPKGQRPVRLPREHILCDIGD
jgi:hypothetical protein